MKTSDFDYLLPPERIAQEPMTPRDHSRLLVLDRKAGNWEHRQFFEIGEFLEAGDLLVVNESKVFNARLVGRLPTGGEVEVFLLRPEGRDWVALAKPGRKLFPGTRIFFKGNAVCTIREKREDGTVLVDFKLSTEEVFALAERVGQVPTPPYVEKPLEEASRYQTIYAKHLGSVAAPTAGFHFTPELMESLKAKGIRFATVTLHVGLGTFRPVKTETLEEHEMHEEWIHIPEETRRAIEETKKNGKRVVAVGTTTVRALESGIEEGFTKIFITPGYTFKTIDALITNFHLPKSTLLVLISALAGRELVMKAYEEAVKEKYRFYSFGDAMFIV